MQIVNTELVFVNEWSRRNCLMTWSHYLYFRRKTLDLQENMNVQINGVQLDKYNKLFYKIFGCKYRRKFNLEHSYKSHKQEIFYICTPSV